MQPVSNNPVCGSNLSNPNPRQLPGIEAQIYSKIKNIFSSNPIDISNRVVSVIDNIINDGDIVKKNGQLLTNEEKINLTNSIKVDLKNYFQENIHLLNPKENIERDKAQKAIEAQNKELAIKRTLLMQNNLVHAFFLIFFKLDVVSNISFEDSIKFFNDKMDNNLLSVKLSPSGDFIFEINSMELIIAYLKEKEHITSCNFLHFENRINDISTLSAYLAQPDCRVKAIGINTNISQEAKDSLSNAVASRNNHLRVVYK